MKILDFVLRLFATTVGLFLAITFTAALVGGVIGLFFAIHIYAGLAGIGGLLLIVVVLTFLSYWDDGADGNLISLWCGVDRGHADRLE